MAAVVAADMVEATAVTTVAMAAADIGVTIVTMVMGMTTGMKRRDTGVAAMAQAMVPQHHRQHQQQRQ
jgi:hypothetical protein